MMKQKLFLLFALLLGSLVPYRVLGWNFSAVAPTGQTLYYIIDNSNTHTVSIVPQYLLPPYYSSNVLSGELEIPSSVTYNGNTYTVTSIDDNAFFGCTGLTSVTLPNSVTSIGASAFYGCIGLSSITLPNSLTNIEFETFRGCTSLTTVSIPNSVTNIYNEAFWGCTSLTSITLPNSVTSIGAFSFQGCTGLTSVTLPNSVTSIGASAFYGCIGLSSITLPNSLTSIGQNAFYLVNNVVYNGDLSGCPWGGKSCNGYIEDSLIFSDVTKTTVVGFVPGLSIVTIPNSVISIRNKAFMRCTSLISVSIPITLTSIGDSAFYDCTGLTSVTIPNSVTCIGDYAFFGCTGLTSVTIPNSVIYIGNYAFFGCTGLTSVTIPNSVTSIGWGSFYGCTGLTNLTIPNSVTSIGQSAFSGCSGLTSVTIPNSVTTIGASAFSGCSGLTSLTIPNSVTRIYYYAFSGCSGLTTLNFNADSCGGYGFSTNYHWLSGCTALAIVNIGNNVRIIPDYFAYGLTGLTSLTIPISVTSIGGSAFYGCTGLTSVTIPNLVTSIGEQAFEDCTGLTLVTMQSITPPSIGSGVFLNTPLDMIVGIPCNTLLAYQQSWGMSFNFIESDPVISVSLQLNDCERGDVSIQQQDGHNITCDSTSIIVATPNYGYSFSHWDNNLLLTDNPRTVSLNQDTQFVAYFQKNVYTLTFQSDNTQWGTVSVDSVSGEYLDTSSQIYANPVPHYHFLRWSDGSTENPRRIVFTEDLSYTAYFAIDTYSVVVQANDIARGTVDGGGVFIYGTPCVASATPYTGYEFQGWSNGVTANPYTFAALEDVTLTAIFLAPEEVTHTVTVSVNDAAMGSATVNGATTSVVMDGATATLTATPNSGYHFVRWADNNTDNPRTITVTEDIDLTAYFQADGTEGIDGAVNDGVTIIARNGRILVSGAEGRQVMLSDALGRILYRGTATEPLTVEAPATGIYLLQVEGHPAHRISVVR